MYIRWIHSILVIVAAGCLMSLPATAQDGELLEPDDDFNKGGRTAFQFLKIGVGARQAAIGEAGLAVVRDVNAVFWNPANITGIESVEVAFSYNRWLADMNYVASAVGARWGRVGVFSLSVATLDYGDIEEALVTASSGSNDPRTGETFSGSDLLFGLTYAREFTDRLSIGVGAKFMRESLFEYAVNNVAFDVGTYYDMGYKGLRLAMSAQNFSGSVRWLGDEASDRQEGYDIPLVFRIGLAANLVGGQDAVLNAGEAHRVTISAEAINTNDFSERFNFGGEYAFGNLLLLRAGYRANYADGNWSFGFGLTPTFGDVAVRIDYAYVHYTYLNVPHRVTLALAF